MTLTLRAAKSYFRPRNKWNIHLPFALAVASTPPFLLLAELSSLHKTPKPAVAAAEDRSRLRGCHSAAPQCHWALTRHPFSSCPPVTSQPTHCCFNLAENLAPDFPLVIPPHQQTIPFVWHMIQKSQLLFVALPIPIYQELGHPGSILWLRQRGLKSCWVWDVCLADVQRKDYMWSLCSMPLQNTNCNSMQNKGSRLTFFEVFALTIFFFLLQCQNALRHTSALKTTIFSSISLVKAFLQAFHFEKTRKTRKGEWAQDNQTCGSCDKKKGKLNFSQEMWEI